jgi:hypothetical protein
VSFLAVVFAVFQCSSGPGCSHVSCVASLLSPNSLLDIEIAIRCHGGGGWRARRPGNFSINRLRSLDSPLRETRPGTLHAAAQPSCGTSQLGKMGSSLQKKHEIKMQLPPINLSRGATDQALTPPNPTGALSPVLSGACDEGTACHASKNGRKSVSHHADSVLSAWEPL